MRFLLEEDGFSVWEPSGSASYRCHALDAVREDGERYDLLFPEGKFLALQKYASTRGGPAAFRTFLEKKTGKSVQAIQ